MPIREYLCERGHKTEKLILGNAEVPAEKECPECRRLMAVEPMFHTDAAVTKLIVSAPFTPSDDYRRAEARQNKFKAGAESVRDVG